MDANDVVYTLELTPPVTVENKGLQGLPTKNVRNMPGGDCSMAGG